MNSKAHVDLAALVARVARFDTMSGSEKFFVPCVPCKAFPQSDLDSPAAISRALRLDEVFAPNITHIDENISGRKISETLLELLDRAVMKGAGSV